VLKICTPITPAMENVRIESVL